VANRVNAAMQAAKTAAQAQAAKEAKDREWRAFQHRALFHINY
jgi:hypothetical protein